MQVRSEEYNIESYNLYNPQLVIEGDEGQSEPWSPYDTLSLEESASDALGRMITINNLTGRIIIRNFAPIDLDRLHRDFIPPIDYL